MRAAESFSLFGNRVVPALNSWWAAASGELQQLIIDVKVGHFDGYMLGRSVQVMVLMSSVGIALSADASEEDSCLCK